MFVILVTIDYNSFNLHFSEVHVHVLLLKVFVTVHGCYCFFGISYYVTPFNIKL